MEMRLSVIQACEVIKRRGVVIYPTETLWGLGGNAQDPEVARRILEIKKIGEPRPMPVLADSFERVRWAISDEPPGFRSLARNHWPGGLTLALPIKDASLMHLARKGMVAFRISANETAEHLCTCADGFLISTSANFTGREPPATIDDVDPTLLSASDGAVIGDERCSGQPSTILVWTGGAWWLARAGAVSIDEIRKLIPSLLEHEE